MPLIGKSVVKMRDFSLKLSGLILLFCAASTLAIVSNDAPQGNTGIALKALAGVGAPPPPPSPPRVSTPPPPPTSPEILSVGSTAPSVRKDSGIAHKPLPSVPGSTNRTPNTDGPFRSGSQVSKKIYIDHAHEDPGFKDKVEKMWTHLSGGNSKSFLAVGGNDRSVFVKGEEQHVIDLEHYIASLDKPIVQVQIDAIILFAQRGYNFDVGIDWSGIYNRAQSIKDSQTPFGFVGAGGALTDYPTSSVAVGSNPLIGSSAISYPGQNPSLFVNPGNFALNLFNKVLTPTTSDTAGNAFVKIPFIFGGPDLSLKRLNLVLNAAENESKVKIVSRPSILTGSGKEATIKIGQQLPMQQSSLNSTTQVTYKGNQITYKDIGITLTVTPTVSSNRKSVNLKISMSDISLVSGNTTSNEDGIMINPPLLSDLVVSNTVLLRNGQTTVIGGLSRRTDKKTKNKIPLLHKLPLVGNLFKASFTSDQELEQYIFITPKVIEQSI